MSKQSDAGHAFKLNAQLYFLRVIILQLCWMSLIEYR